jgi:hypothetical protein
MVRFSIGASGSMTLLVRMTPIELRHPGAVPGSRLLLTDGAAIILSGSPPRALGFAIARHQFHDFLQVSACNLNDSK